MRPGAHLVGNETQRFRKEFLEYGYNIGGKACRVPGWWRVRGGVLSPVSLGISFRGVPGVELPQPPIDACSLALLSLMGPRRGYLEHCGVLPAASDK